MRVRALVEGRVQGVGFRWAMRRRARSLGLSVADAHAALAVVPGAEKFAAEKRVRTHTVFSDSGRSDAQASGISADWFELSSLQVAKGRPLNAEDEQALAPVAVIGHQAAAELVHDNHVVHRAASKAVVLLGEGARHAVPGVELDQRGHVVRAGGLRPPRLRQRQAPWAP